MLLLCQPMEQALSVTTPLLLSKENIDSQSPSIEGVTDEIIPHYCSNVKRKEEKSGIFCLCLEMLCIKRREEGMIGESGFLSKVDP